MASAGGFEGSIRIVADLHGNPALDELAAFALGLQDVFYVGGLLEGRDNFAYTVADRFSPELVNLTKASRSFTISRLRMESPLLLEIIAYGSGMLSLGYGALKLWRGVENLRVERSRNQVEMEINKQLVHQLRDVNHYFQGFEGRFDVKALDIRNPREAEQVAAKTLSQVQQFEIEASEPPQLPSN